MLAGKNLNSCPDSDSDKTSTLVSQLNISHEELEDMMQIHFKGSHTAPKSEKCPT